MNTNYRITDRGDHLRVDFFGTIGFADIAGAIQAQAEIPGFNQRNDIWVFRDVVVDLNFDRLDDLTALVQQVNADGAFSTRTAIVADPGFNAAVGEMWLQTVSSLPWDIAMFENEDEALAWIGA